MNVIKTEIPEVKIIEPVIMDGVIQKDVLEKNGYDESWIIHQLKNKQINEVMYAVVEKDRLFFVEK